VSILLLFTSSALSHIFPEIRVDAIRFVDLMLEISPRLVVSGWIDDSSSVDAEGRAETSVSGGSRHGQQVLRGYLGLFELKGKSGGAWRGVVSLPFE
jgi:pre-rRNA-processing protein IPI1